MLKTRAEIQTRAFWGSCAAAMASSRGDADDTTARQHIEELAAFGYYGTRRVRASAAKALRVIDGSPFSIFPARHAARKELTWLATRGALAKSPVMADDVPLGTGIVRSLPSARPNEIASPPSFKSRSCPVRHKQYT